MGVRRKPDTCVEVNKLLLRIQNGCHCLQERLWPPGNAALIPQKSPRLALAPAKEEDGWANGGLCCRFEIGLKLMQKKWVTETKPSALKCVLQPKKLLSFQNYQQNNENAKKNLANTHFGTELSCANKYK